MMCLLELFSYFRFDTEPNHSLTHTHHCASNDVLLLILMPFKATLGRVCSAAATPHWTRILHRFPSREGREPEREKWGNSWDEKGQGLRWRQFNMKSKAKERMNSSFLISRWMFSHLQEGRASSHGIFGKTNAITQIILLPPSWPQIYCWAWNYHLHL